jgi:hypothetical protein
LSKSRDCAACHDSFRESGRKAQRTNFDRIRPRGICGRLV